ncbi:MAG: creatininase family protein [Verrucomicrobiales bacterium]|nr:creatininase family protein [Verrucomicrobiales bacterium]
MTWRQVSDLSKDTPVVIPVAALEQHGHHMPLFTDSQLLAEVIRRAALSLGDKLLITPLQWLGNSDHHLDFPGTLSAAPRVYLDILTGLADNFIHHGFRRIVFINGHGGNDVPGKQTVFELRQKYRQRKDLLLLFGTYWLLGQQAHQPDPAWVQHQMGHACEWETSMMLRIAPHLVGNYQAAPDVPFGNPFEPASRGWVTQDRTEPGHIGSPKASTADKGEALLSRFAGDVVALLNRVVAWDGKSWEG